MCDLGADASRAPSSKQRIAQLNAELDARGLASGRTTGCPTNGSRPTACPASRSRSTSRIRGSRSSSSRRCSKSKAATPSRACGSCATRPGTRSTTPTSCAAGRRGGGCSAIRRRSIPSTTRRSRTARASCSTSITGTRRAIPTRTSPRPSRCGSIRSRLWATRYAGWPAQRKLEYMDRLMRELAHTAAARQVDSAQVDPLPQLKKTLGEHYRKKREHYGLDHPGFLRERPAQPVLRRAAVRQEPVGGALRPADPQAKCAARSPASPTATSTRSISCSRRSSSAAAS